MWSDWSYDCDPEPTYHTGDCRSLQVAVLWAYLGVILGLCVNVVVLMPLMFKEKRDVHSLMDKKLSSSRYSDLESTDTSSDSGNTSESSSLSDENFDEEKKSDAKAAVSHSDSGSSPENSSDEKWVRWCPEWEAGL